MTFFYKGSSHYNQEGQREEVKVLSLHPTLEGRVGGWVGLALSLVLFLSFVHSFSFSLALSTLAKIFAFKNYSLLPSQHFHLSVKQYYYSMFTVVVFFFYFFPKKVYSTEKK